MSPLAGPVASSAEAQTAPNGGARAALTPTKDKRLYRRLSPRQVEAISRQLSARDREVLLLVSRFGVMSGAQLRSLLWPEGTPQTTARLARKALARLAGLDVLQSLARRVGGTRSGSASTTYALGRAGQYLLQSERASKRRVRRAHTPGERYLAHRLAVGQLYVDLAGVQRRGQLEILAFDPEPDCWRPYAGAWGARLTLKPDAYSKLAIGDYVYSYFIEQDMATEAQTTIESKARRYFDYYRTGTEQTAGGVFPRVLWIVPHTAHAERVSDTLGRLPADAHKLFAITTAPEAAGFLTSEVRP